MKGTRPAGVTRGIALLLPLRRWPWTHFVFFWSAVIASSAVAYLHYTSPPPDLSLSTYRRISLGMTEDEVEAIIRARPGSYGYTLNPRNALHEATGESARAVFWNDGHAILTVGYDAEGRACSKRLEYGELPPETRPRPAMWERLTRRYVPGRERAVLYTHF